MEHECEHGCGLHNIDKSAIEEPEGECELLPSSVGINGALMADGLAVAGEVEAVTATGPEHTSHPGDELLERSITRSASGFLGVYQTQSGNRWEYECKRNGKRHCRGSWLTALEAARARRQWLVAHPDSAMGVEEYEWEHGRGLDGAIAALVTKDQGLRETKTRNDGESPRMLYSR